MFVNVILLGIDPGLNNTGWGVIQFSTKYQLINCGVIKTNAKDEISTRLIYIYNEVKKIIDIFQPEKIAIERVFVNINPLSSEKLIMARTAAYLASAQYSKVFEFSPNEIKRIITGNGRSDKKIVKQYVLNTLQVENIAQKSDATDALAVAICLSLNSSIIK